MNYYLLYFFSIQKRDDIVLNMIYLIIRKKNIFKISKAQLTD